MGAAATRNIDVLQPDRMDLVVDQHRKVGGHADIRRRVEKAKAKAGVAHHRGHRAHGIADARGRYLPPGHLRVGEERPQRHRVAFDNLAEAVDRGFEDVGARAEAVAGLPEPAPGDVGNAYDVFGHHDCPA
jgi:hypothetical protein